MPGRQCAFLRGGCDSTKHARYARVLVKQLHVTVATAAAAWFELTAVRAPPSPPTLVAHRKQNMRAARTLPARHHALRPAAQRWLRAGTAQQRWLSAVPKRDAETTTHFGFADVPVEEKTAKVKDVFYEVAERYDIMNDLMSGGLHRCCSTQPPIL